MRYNRFFLIAGSLLLSMLSLTAQNRSTSTEVRKGNNERTVPRSREDDNAPTAQPVVKQSGREAPGANVGWMRMIYRDLDLDKEKNAALYYPEDVIDGQENLFRLVLRLVASGAVPAYEFLDGREVFTPEFQVKVPELLDRFYIPYHEAKGSTSRNPRYEIDELDVPANEVMSYYIIEKWEFDTRKNSTVATVQAICPVLHRSGEFGEETLRYPMFWVSMESIKPYLKNTSIFVDDFDNNPRYSIDDYFTMNMYDGEIYKTRNVRNKSMMQLYPDEDARKQAADSIQKSLKQFDKVLWVPSREEVLEARKAKEEKEKGEELGAIPAREEKKEASKRKPARSSRAKKESMSSSGGSSGSAVRSVRDRKR